MAKTESAAAWPVAVFARSPMTWLPRTRRKSSTTIAATMSDNAAAAVIWRRWPRASQIAAPSRTSASRNRHDRERLEQLDDRPHGVELLGVHDLDHAGALGQPRAVDRQAELVPTCAISGRTSRTTALPFSRIARLSLLTSAMNWSCVSDAALAQSACSRGDVEQLLDGPDGRFAQRAGGGRGEPLQARRQRLAQLRRRVRVVVDLVDEVHGERAVDRVVGDQRLGRLVPVVLLEELACRPHREDGQDRDDGTG